MVKLKKISVIALLVSVFAMPVNASAQVDSGAPESAQPVSATAVKSAEAAPRATPKLISARSGKRSVKRVIIAPVPGQASAEQLQKRYTSEGVFNAGASGRNKPTRFIYTRVKDHSQARVLFNESSLNSR